MTRPIAAAIVLALALTAGGSTSASGWGASCGDVVAIHGPPPPVYVYDHQGGPTWTGNGWAYLPIGQYHPRPDIIPDPRLLFCLLPF
jgi:hypothetical protein